MKNNTLALFYKNKEVTYPGYSAVELSSAHFTKPRKNIVKNKIHILFPPYSIIGGSCLIDEVRLKDFFCQTYSERFDDIKLSFGMRPSFREGKLIVTLK